MCQSLLRRTDVSIHQVVLDTQNRALSKDLRRKGWGNRREAKERGNAAGVELKVIEIAYTRTSPEDADGLASLLFTLFGSAEKHIITRVH